MKKIEERTNTTEVAADKKAYDPSAKTRIIYRISLWWNVIYTTMMLQMKQSFARPMFRFCLLLNPVVNTFFLYEMFLNSGEENFLIYVILGGGLMGLWGCICFSSAGDINRERYSGTLPLIYVAPAGFGSIILGKILGNTLLSLLAFVLSYGTACLISGTFVPIICSGAFIGALALTVLSFILVSLCIAYLLMLSRKTELYMNLIELPFILLCGFTFPIEILPQWVQCISVCFAPTWAVRLLRISVEGTGPVAAKTCYEVLILELVLMLLFLKVIYEWMKRRVRIKATLEVS